MSVDPGNPFAPNAATSTQPGQDNPFALSPTTSPAAAPHESLLRRAANWVKRTENSPQAKLLDYFAALPAEGINALLGAPQRVVAERLGNATKNPRGVAETAAGPLIGPLSLLDPRGREEAGNEVYAAFHPNDPGIEAGAESAAGVNKLLTDDPRFRGKLRNFVVRTGFENLTDPLNYATAGTVGAGEMGLKALGRAGTRALESPNDVIRGTAENMLTNVEERRGGFSTKEIATVNSIRQRGITTSRVQHTADEAMLHAYRKDLQAGEIPDEIRQRLLREPYVYGTPEMREQAIQNGYKPTAAEAAKEPEALLEYNLRSEYDPHTGMMNSPQRFDSLLLGEEEKLRAPKAGMEQQQKGEATPETLYDRLSRRLAQGRAVVRYRSTAKGLQQHVGVGPEMANSLATDSKLGGFPLAQSVSKAQVDALLATGLPHMRNVGVMGWNSLGELGLARALQLTAKPDAKLAERLEQGGASHFGIRTPGKYSPARLMPIGVRRTTTGLLDRFDNALRSARLEQLDKESPGMDEFEKLDRVNQDLGAYNLKPQYVKWLQSHIGANFPQWHNYVVPTSVARAVVRNPGRVERLSRYEQNANDTFLKNAPYRITLGGPNDEAASAAADPIRVLLGKYPSYFGGPSSLGPAAYALRASSGANHKFAERAAMAASNFVPLGSPVLDALLNPYRSPLSPLGRAAAGAAGVYAQKRPPQSLRRTSGQESQGGALSHAPVNSDNPFAP